MTDTTTISMNAARKPGRALAWGVIVAWVAVYLLLMAHGGWKWTGRGVLGFGMPSDVSLERFGTPIPQLVEGGDWHRLLLGMWLHTSLLGVLFLMWFWASIGRRLAGLLGTARGWLVFVAGGVGAAGTHVVAFSGTSYPGGAGPFGGIMGGLGALFLWALLNKGPVAKVVMRSTVFTILFIAVLTWLFTAHFPDNESVRAMVGIQAEIGAFVSGLLVMAALGPRRSNDPPAMPVKVIAFAALGLVVAAAAIQAPKVLASADREGAKRFLAELGYAELDAWQIAQRPFDSGNPDRRRRLGIRLDALPGYSFIQGHEGESALRAYLDALRAYLQTDVNPFEAEARCRDTFRVWFRDFEEPMRRDMGLEPRSRVRHFWEPQ